MLERGWRPTNKNAILHPIHSSERGVDPRFLWAMYYVFFQSTSSFRGFNTLFGASQSFKIFMWNFLELEVSTNYLVSHMDPTQFSSCVDAWAFNSNMPWNGFSTSINHFVTPHVTHVCCVQIHDIPIPTSGFFGSSQNTERHSEVLVSEAQRGELCASHHQLLVASRTNQLLAGQLGLVRLVL